MFISLKKAIRLASFSLLSCTLLSTYCSAQQDVSSDGYAVIINFDEYKRSAHVEIKKDSRVISSLDADIYTPDRTSFFVTKYWAPYIDIAYELTMQNKPLLIELNDGLNRFKLLVYPTGDVQILELDTQESFSLITQETGLIAAYSAVYVKKNLCISSNSGRLSIDNNTQWRIGGTVNLSMGQGYILFDGTDIKFTTELEVLPHWINQLIW